MQSKFVGDDSSVLNGFISLKYNFNFKSGPFFLISIIWLNLIILSLNFAFWLTHI